MGPGSRAQNADLTVGPPKLVLYCLTPRGRISSHIHMYTNKSVYFQPSSCYYLTPPIYICVYLALAKSSSMKDSLSRNGVYFVYRRSMHNLRRTHNQSGKNRLASERIQTPSGQYPPHPPARDGQAYTLALLLIGAALQLPSPHKYQIPSSQPRLESGRGANL